MMAKLDRRELEQRVKEELGQHKVSVKASPPGMLLCSVYLDVGESGNLTFAVHEGERTAVLDVLGQREILKGKTWGVLLKSVGEWLGRVIAGYRPVSEGDDIDSVLGRAGYRFIQHSHDFSSGAVEFEVWKFGDPYKLKILLDKAGYWVDSYAAGSCIYAFERKRGNEFGSAYEGAVHVWRGK